MARECPSPYVNLQPGNQSFTCYECQGFGHAQSAAVSSTRNFFSRTQPTTQVNQITDNFQPLNPPLPAQPGNSQHSNHLSFAINGNLDLTAVSVTIAGENIPMVLDSGSSVSLIDHEFYLYLKCCHMILEETQQPTLTLRTANGNAIAVTNEVLVPMTLAPDCNISIRFKVAKHISTRLLAGVGTMTRMGAVLNFSRRSVYFEALHLNVPWCKPHTQPADSIYCLQITKHLSMPRRSAMFIDVDHNLPPSSCPSNREAYVTKSTTSDLPQAFHLTPGIATLHDLHNHSTPFIVVNTSDEPLSLPPKITVAHLEVLDGTNVTISNFSDARDDVIPQAQHVVPPAPIPTDTSTAMHSPVANSQEPTPPPLLSNWQPLFDDLEIDANPHLTESQKAELKNLVIEYSDIFQPSTAGLQQMITSTIILTQETPSPAIRLHTASAPPKDK